MFLSQPVTCVTGNTRNTLSLKSPGIIIQDYFLYTQFDLGLLPTAAGYPVYIEEQDHIKLEVKKVVLGPDGGCWMIMIFL